MRIARSAVVWAGRYGLPGVAIKLAARSGDVVARSAGGPATIADPAGLFAQLRDLGPVVSNRMVHASAHYGVVNDVLRHENFRSATADAATPLLTRLVLRAVDPNALGPIDVPSLLAIDPPEHGRIRKLVAHAFTPRAIAGYEERIAKLANALLDDVDATGPFDLIGDYAMRLPISVIAEIMGVPPELRDTFQRIGNDAAATLDPVLSWRRFRTADRALREGNALIDAHVARLRATPSDDLDDNLVASMLRAAEDGDRLSDRELRVNILLLIGAGFETTVNLIGNAVALLLRHRDQLDALRAEPSGWANAVEEVLRFDSPVQAVVRAARVDTDIAGTTVRTDRLMLLMIGAANRDPAVFPDGDSFDVTRPNARQHLAFSSGIHYCIGAQLARLEAAVALRTLFERFPELAGAGPAVRRSTRVLRGFETLPVRAA